MSKKLDARRQSTARVEDASTAVEVIKPKPLTVAVNWTWTKDRTVSEQKHHNNAAASTPTSTEKHFGGEEDITLDYGFLMDRNEEFDQLRNVEEYLLHREDEQWDELFRDIHEWNETLCLN